MAKEIGALIKLQVKGGAANPSPPIVPALGAKGVNIMEFCKQFNARTQDQAGKVLLTLKIPKTNQLDCIEKELEISDASEMEAIILLLGFEKASFTEKFRRKGTVGDLEICVDSVTDL